MNTETPKTQSISSLRDCDAGVAVNVCCRQSGRAVLQDVIERLRRRADDLQRLCDMLPAQPTPEQDEALWNVACTFERR